MRPRGGRRDSWNWISASQPVHLVELPVDSVAVGGHLSLDAVESDGAFSPVSYCGRFVCSGHRAPTGQLSER